MPTAKLDVRTVSRLFRALGDETRLRIIALLAHGELCVCHLQDALGLPQPTVSRHLAYLRRSGLVSTRRDGLWVHYRLAEIADPSVRAALSAAIHAVGHAPATRTDQQRLDARIDREPHR